MSRDSGHPHVYTSHHVATIVGAVAEVAAFVDDPTEGEVVVAHLLGGALLEQMQAVVATSLGLLVLEAGVVEEVPEFVSFGAETVDGATYAT